MSNFTVMALRPCLRHRGQRRADPTGIRLGHKVAHDLRHGLKGRLGTLHMLVKSPHGVLRVARLARRACR